MSRCKGCGNPIVWVSNQNGKNMPCDPGFVPYWEDKNGDSIIINGEGRTVRCFLDGEPETMTDTGRIPHWATCPQADMFRKKR